jgi:sugar/nucleoside kinase (ribokinase family)
MNETKLLVVGSLAYDQVETPRRPAAWQLGGSATFISLAASHLVRTAVVGVVGKDFKQADLDLLVGKGVDISGIETAEGETFKWGGRYDAQLKERETLFTELGVFAQFSPKIPAALADAPYLFLGNCDPDLQLAVLDSMKGLRWVAADTMNLWINIKRESLLRLLGRVNALFLNDSEAELLTGEKNVVKAGHAIMAMGPSTVIIKRGEYGCVVISGDGVFALPALPLEQVEDPTGAGDSFAGGFMAHLASTGDLSPLGIRNAAAFGTVTASFCVEDFGPAPLARLDRATLDGRLKLFANMLSLPWGGCCR